MSSEIAIKTENISKCYQIYETPRCRLKQFVYTRIQRAAKRPVRQYYRDFWALRNVSFEVTKGETLGIIGRNGSGKSTLLQVICNTLHPSGGTVVTNGRVAALLELGSGFNFEFTGRENVYLNASILGLSKAEIDGRFDSIVKFADIGDFIEQPVKTYSSGMVVRLAFSVAINVEPDILVVDEALSVGDELFQRKCFARIESIREKGTTILFVSHSAPTVIELCDRAMLLEHGKKLAVGSPKEIVGLYQKMIYAPDDKRQKVIEQISNLVECNTKNATSYKETTSDKTIQTKGDHKLQESYDPNLKPSSTIEYESHGVCIESPTLRTLDGQQVNNLIGGRTYRFSYAVNFVKKSSKVRFAFAVKTVSGLELGGALSAANFPDAIPVVDPGTKINVTFTFQATLNQGSYYLNAGVRGMKEEKETYLHRIIDAYAFRILPQSNSCATAIIDFSAYAEFDILRPKHLNTADFRDKAVDWEVTA